MHRTTQPLVWSVFRAFLAAWLAFAAAAATARVRGAEGHAPALPNNVPGVERPFPRDGEKFTFAIIGDKTGGGLENWPIFDRAMEEVSYLRPDFAIMVGDLIQGYTTDVAVMDAQWKEFVEHASRIQIPFFFLPGNHDISNKAMYDYWDANVGRTYYSFNYKGCHFVLLNTEEGWRTDEVQFGAEQMEWVRKDIAEHRDAKHIFFFMHKPVWYHSGEALAQWEMIESWINGLPYTVFAGHFHNLSYETRRDRRYYVLSATGAGLTHNDLLEMGAFHHYTTVTVDGDDVHIALIRPGNVHPHDTSRREFKDRARQLASWRSEWPVVAPPTLVEVAVTTNNTLDRPVTVRGRFVPPQGGAWRSNPTEASHTVAPGEQDALGFLLQYDFEKFLPLPTFTYEVSYGDAVLWRGSQRIAPQLLPIRDWMVVGPFALGVAAVPAGGSGLETAPVAFVEALGPEKDADTERTYGDDGLGWKEAGTEEGGWVNFDAVYGGNYRIAYALCYIHSPDERLVYAGVRGDDLFRVWVNGEAAFAAGFTREPAYFPLRLKRGVNAVLVKTADYAGDWGFSLGIADVSARVLGVSRTPSEQARPLR